MAEQNVSMKSLNKVSIAGYLKQVNLEVKQNDEKENYVTGSLVIQYGKDVDQQVEVKVYKKEYTQGGSVAKAYENLTWLMSDGITYDKATDEKPATIVSINGNGDFTPELKLNEYAKDGEYRSNPEVSLGFGNVGINKVTPEQFKGSFEITLYLHKDVSMEKDKDQDETGRLIVEGLYVTHKGEVKPMMFLVKDEDVVEGMSGLMKNQVITVWGDIKIARIKEVKEKKSGFGGKAKTDETVTTVSELIITGGEEVDEDNKGYIAPDFVARAYKERETFIENLIKGEGETKTEKPKAGGFKGGSSPSTPKTDKPKKAMPF